MVDMQPVPVPDPLSGAELTLLLGLGFQLVLTEFLRRVGATDLRPVHGAVFQALRGGGATSTELAQRLGITKQAAGQIVDELERLGYLARQPHPAGGRRRLVVLTARAHEHLVVAGGVLHQLERELAAGVGEAELGELRVRLAQVIRLLAGADLPPLRPVW